RKVPQLHDTNENRDVVEIGHTAPLALEWRSIFLLFLKVIAWRAAGTSDTSAYSRRAEAETRMQDFAIAWDWLAFAVRWLHVVTAIAWIGSSFYFIALDLGLRQRPTLPQGAHGEEWQVHGGGFYHIQKYLVAPAALPEHLTW